MSLSNEMSSIAEQSLLSPPNLPNPSTDVDAELEQKIAVLGAKLSERIQNNGKVKYIFSTISNPEFSFHFGKIYRELLTLLDGHKKYSGLNVLQWFEHKPYDKIYSYNYPTGGGYTDVIDRIYTFLKVEFDDLSETTSTPRHKLVGAEGEN